MGGQFTFIVKKDNQSYFYMVDVLLKIRENPHDIIVSSLIYSVLKQLNDDLFKQCLVMIIPSNETFFNSHQNEKEGIVSEGILTGTPKIYTQSIDNLLSWYFTYKYKETSRVYLLCFEFEVNKWIDAVHRKDNTIKITCY